MNTIMHVTRSARLICFTLTALLAGLTSAVAFAAEPVGQFVQTQSAGSVDVTVYGNSFAQVEETRKIDLKAGCNRIQLDGIAAQYTQDSLRIIAVRGPGKFSYRSATYQNANLSWEQILAASVGGRITAPIGSGGTVSGKLLNASGARLIIKGDDGKTHFTGISGVSLDRMPAGLSSTASLVVEADVSQAGSYELNFLYETGGMTWSAKHSLIYDDDSQKLESFETTVNVVNQSGTTFDKATLWLLSGNVNQAYEPGRRLYARSASLAAASADAAPVESVGERKVYRIPGKVSLTTGQSRQIPLFSAASVPVTREYYLPAYSGYGYRSQSGLQPVSVRLQLTNCKDNNLGTPLPAGSVKVYERNSERKLQLTGSTSVKEIARDEAFTLQIGTSSDVKAERKLVSSVQVSNRAASGQLEDYEDTYKVTIHNFKDKGDVDVIVEAGVPAEQPSVAPLTRKTATLATASVKVGHGQEIALTYKIHAQR